MNAEELIQRSPMSVVVASLRGGLDAGEIGGVLARAGVGKTALLIHVAWGYALRGTDVLHVSLTDGHARVRRMYTELHQELARAVSSAESERFGTEVDRHCHIHCSLNDGFAVADLQDVLETLGEGLRVRPSVVLIDGFESRGAELDQWRKFAQDHGVRLWFGVRTHRSEPQAISRFCEALDTAVVLEPSGPDIRLNVVKAGGRPVDRSGEILLDPVSMMIRTEQEGDPTEVARSTPPPALCTVYSGGASGAEACFGETAAAHGVGEVNFTFDGHNQARTSGQMRLDEAELACGDVSLIYVAHRLHRHWDQTDILRKVLQTQWHIVANASQLFVVGAIQADGTVHGGTGWSVELAKRWSKPVWVFDQEACEWFRWNGTNWAPDQPTITAPAIAGTGTRFLNDAGRHAIQELFSKSFGPNGSAKPGL